MEKFDCVIRGASVFDGISAEPSVCDVGIRAERIAAVGLDLPAGRREISAAGMHLAPGFIDVHAHDDFAVLLEPELPFKLLQGITTEIVGNCGIGPAPRRGAAPWIERFHPGVRVPDYDDTRSYLRAVEEAGPSLHVAVLAGHGSLRQAVIPDAGRTPSAREWRALEAALDEALEAGVIGLSTGLVYEPGRRAEAAELVRLLARARGSAPLYATHLRSEAEELVPAVREAIFIAEEAGVGLQLSHHKASGRDNWGRVSETLGLVDRAIERGVDVWLDQYPYTAGSTILRALVEGQGEGRRLEKLGPEDVVIASVEGHPELEGLSLARIMESGLTKDEAAEHVLTLDPGAWIVIFAMSEDDVETVMRHPRTLFGSDGLPTSHGRPHPRLWGTFPRIFGRYVRERGVVGLGEAVRRATGAAARRFGLVDRGEIRPGAYADLVLFDAARILDEATYDQPRRAPTGVDSVWVDGVSVVQGGAHTGARPGRVLRRGA